MITPVLVIAGVVSLLAAVLPLVPADAWWVRGFDFPRLQFTALALVALAGFVVVQVEPQWLDRAFTVALAAGVGFQLTQIFPYTRLARPQVQLAATRDGPGIRLLLVNVLMENRDAARLLSIIRDEDPDAILAAETDEWWAAQLDALAPALPHVVAHPLDNTYGMVFRSRLELVDPRVRFLVQDDVPSVHALIRLASGDEIEFHGVHPRPPSPQENDRSTERDAELLLVAKRVKDSPRPVIVAGDLNDVAWSRTTRMFQHLSGLLDPRIGRGRFSTFHAQYPVLRWPLDHVFHSRHFRLRELRRLPGFGSDHFPVLIDLALEPDAVRTQEEPHAEPGEHAEAEEKIEKARGG